MTFLFTQIWIFYFKNFNSLILTSGNALFLQTSYLKSHFSRSASFFLYSNICLPALKIQLLYILKLDNYCHNLPQNVKYLLSVLTNTSFLPTAEDYNLILKKLLLAFSDPYIMVVIIFLFKSIKHYQKLNLKTLCFF